MCFKKGENYYGGKVSLSDYTYQEDHFIVSDVGIYDKIPKPIYGGTLSNTPNFRIYKWVSGSWVVSSDSGFDVYILRGGSPSSTSNQWRYYALLDGPANTLGTYLVAYQSGDSLIGTQFKIVDTWSEIQAEIGGYYVEYPGLTLPNLGTEWSIFVQKGLLRYGLPLNARWDNFAVAEKNGNTIVGKRTNKFYTFQGYTVTGGMSGTYPYSDTPYILNPDNLNSDVTFTANISSTPESFTLTYTQHSGNTSVIRRVTVESGVPISEPDPGTQDHYTFKEWDWNGEKVSFPLILFTDVELVDEWIPNKYTVSFSITEGAVPSVIQPITDSYLKNITLPNLTLANYYFSGWSDGTTIYPPNTSYRIVSDITLTSVFTANQYTVRFYDYGQSEPLSTQVITYPNRATLPENHIASRITYIGWYDKNTFQRIIPPSDTSYQPTADIDLIRIYTYSVPLWDTLKDTFVFDNSYTANYPETINLPRTMRSPVDGYELNGWGINVEYPTPSQVYSGSYTYTPQYTVENNAIIPQNIPQLFSKLKPKELQSLSTDVNSIVVMVRETIDIEVTTTPSDWVGNVEYSSTVSQGDISSYLNITKIDGRTIRLSGVRANEQVTITLTIKGKKQTWNEQSQYVEINLPVSIYDSKLIYFYTRDVNGNEIPYNNNIVDNKESNVFFVSTQTGDWELKGSRLYPEDPPREGYEFIGWVDGDGNLVDLQHPPSNPTDCFATWTYLYSDMDRDSAYLQLFNFDNDRMLKQIDLGILQSHTETFNMGISSNATPTMESKNTFITNLNCTETISVNIIRKSPDVFNDKSDNPRDWSNSKWITEMRGLVDRWQSSTDGIKFLMLPRNLRIAEVVGKLMGYGDNYDMLGYVSEYDTENKYNNLGLIFEQNNTKYVLKGYNGIFGSYTDTYTAQNKTVIEVTFSITLGGMKSRYQDWRDALVMKNA